MSVFQLCTPDGYRGADTGEEGEGGLKAAWDDIEEGEDAALDALLAEEPALNPGMAEMWRDDPDLWARLSEGGRETLSRSMFGDCRAAGRTETSRPGRRAAIVTQEGNDHMADEPENLTLRLLQEMRAEMRDGFEKMAAETGRVHADLKGDVAALRLDLSRVDASVAKMHADVLFDQISRA